MLKFLLELKAALVTDMLYNSFDIKEQEGAIQSFLDNDEISPETRITLADAMLKQDLSLGKQENTVHTF